MFLCVGGFQFLLLNVGWVLKEAFVDPARDESLIIELLDFKHDVGDNGSATWFLQDLATEQEADGSVVIDSQLLHCVC